MDTNRYCKNCGRVVKEITQPDDTQCWYECECTEDELSYKDVIAGWTRKARIDQLKAMHELMMLANDESIYYSWIYLMPDEPSEEDFIDIALDDEMYNACFDKFVKLIKDEDCRW